ncbi:MAG TPA: hypothetical protein DCS28_03790 [Candidatus Moranbacteria bacterium]|nr:hypothetical protein [Candidatus Moranbacteria bacterium]HAT75133.1 hypothetical protein [Candidatus Moranbacteria bacterium]
MLFNVPQFIDIEDKIVGPLTAKQMGWLAMGGVIALVCYSLLDQSAFWISVIIIAVIFGALAFYRPYNQPLIKFILSSISFATRPKMYIWRRISEKTSRSSAKKQTAVSTIGKKNIDAKNIEDVSRLLDRQNR